MQARENTASRLKARILIMMGMCIFSCFIPKLFTLEAMLRLSDLSMANDVSCWIQ